MRSNPNTASGANLSTLIEENQHEEIRKFLEHAKSTNYSHQHEVCKAFVKAMMARNREVVRMFFEAGFDADDDSVTVPIQGWEYISNVSVKEAAVRSGDLGMVKLVAEFSKVGFKRHSRELCNMLAMAFTHNFADIFAYLLTQGANANDEILDDHSSYRGTNYWVRAAGTSNHAMMHALDKHGHSSHLVVAIFEVINNFYPQRCQSEFEDAKSIASFKKSLEEYTSMIVNLLDYADGVDLPENLGLKFIHPEMNLYQMSLLGVSIDGVPIDRAMLSRLPNAGKEGVVFLPEEIEHIQNPERRSRLQERAKVKMPSQGGFLTESNVVNLVPLVMAIKKGNEQTAVQRLAAPGIDPNATCGISFNNRGFSHDIVSPVSAIGKFNRMEILEQLVSHPKFDMQSIHEAIRVARINGNHELARELSTRLPVNSFDANGNTMLLHAINDGAVEDVKQLLERGADPDLAGTLGKPLLHAINCIQFTDFSMRGEPSATHVAIVRLLLDKNVNTAIKDDWDSPLQAAGKTVCPQVFAWLSETAKFEPVMHQGFDKVTRCGVIIEYPWYVDILHHSYRYAIQGDRMRQDDWLALMTYLAQHYPEVNFDISERAAGSTLLQKVMEDLIFASQLECNSAGLRFDAGMFGTSMPNDDIKKQTRMSKQSSFMLQLDILLFLFKQPSVNPLTGKNHETGDTLLHDFINKSTLAHLPGVVARVLDLWLRRGFSLDVTNMQGHTLLHTAVLANNLVALEFLLQCGANVNACDKEGNTPLHCTKSAEAIKLLLAYNADTTLRNQQMETPNEKILKKKAGLVLKRNIFQTSRRPYDTFDKAIILTDRMSALLTTEPRVTIKSHEVVLRKVEALKRYKETAIFRPAEVECAAYAQHPALKLYCDYKTGQIMQKPVYVKGRAYNLSTVEACFAERIVKDPITGAEFDITDVIPAYDLQAHMHTAVGIIARSEGESRSAREAIENHQASVKRYI